MTQNKETKQAYIKRGRQLMERVYKEASSSGNSGHNNPIVYKIGPYTLVALSFLDTATWIRRNWNSLYSSSTVRQYRSALKFMGEIFVKREDISYEEYIKACSILDTLESASKKDIKPRTSAQKQKSLNLKDLKKLGDILLKTKNKWGKLSYIWLYSGIFTGLRPSEWKNANIIEDDNSINLIVKNAKNTNNRSHGETRTINLNHLEKKQVNIIKQHLNAAKKISQKNELWNQYYNGCSNLIKNESRKIWKSKKRYPTLYSSRHQFSANLKASGCSKIEVATLMGHANDLTAQAHYGKKIHGTRGKKPKVDQQELKRVIQKNKKFVFRFEKSKN